MNNPIRRLLWMLTGCIPLVALAQISPLDKALDGWLGGARMSPDLWGAEGAWIYDRAAATGQCDSMLMGYTLLLSALNYGVDVEVPAWDSLRCTRLGYFAANAEGQRAFDRGDINSAKAWYKRALEDSFTPQQRADTKNNIGLCYYWEDDLDAALQWMVASKDEGMMFQSGNSLNTLATVSLSLGAIEQSLEYAKAAESKLLEEFNNGMDLESFVLYRDLILLNQAAAHLELGQMDQARQQFNRAQLDAFFPGLGPEFFHMAFILAWRFDNPTLLVAHEASFAAALLDDSIAAVERFGPALGLIAPWRSQLGGSVEEVWIALHQISLDQLPELPAPSDAVVTDASGFFSRPWLLGAAAWMFLGLLGLGCLWKARRGRVRLPINREELDLSLLQKALVPGAIEEVRKAAWSNLSSSNLNRGISRQLRELSKREMEVLLAAVTGERPKETAERLHMQISSIYSIRSSLRSKLGINQDVELETWIQSEWLS